MAFVLGANQAIDLVVDFNACQSVLKASKSGQYILKPVMSVTPAYTTAIEGYVTTTLAVSSTVVSAQQNGAVLRSTVPDANGRFLLGFLPSGTYTVVISADSHATGVVSSVPVTSTTGVTTVNGTATAIVLPTSVMNTVTGTVTASTSSGSGTSTSAVSNATVTALQTLSTGQIAVASTAVHFDLGSYTLKLPSAAPVRAPYASGTLTASTRFSRGRPACRPSRRPSTSRAEARTRASRTDARQPVPSCPGSWGYSSSCWGAGIL